MPQQPQHRFRWYEGLYRNSAKIVAEASRIGKQLGIASLQGKVGLYSASSSCPAGLPNHVLQAIARANASTASLSSLWDQLREITKDVFGDGYDVAVTNTCESALRIINESLFAPPALNRGLTYRAKCLIPYTEDHEFHGGYGRPFPPRYKHLFMDRSVSAGELGVEGKVIPNLESLFVRLVGARYESHGIRYNTVSLLQDVDSSASARHIAEVAQCHSAELVGFQALAYDTPGYAHGTKDKNGVPLLLRKISELAKSYDLPFVVDAASCVPIISLSPEQLGADVMTWSMDKVARAPISGLIVGTEEALSPMRKGLGIAGQRYGEMRSHGKAAYSFADPGRDALAGLVEVLNTLRTNPERYTKPVDEMFTIVQEQFSQHLARRDFLPDILITKSYLMGGIEVNYGRTWKQEAFGIPIFSAEDLFANTNPIMAAMTEMGVYPATVYSGNIFLSPGFGNLDQNGELLHNETRLAVRALVESINLVCRFAGLLD